SASPVISTARARSSGQPASGNRVRSASYDMVGLLVVLPRACIVAGVLAQRSDNGRGRPAWEGFGGKPVQSRRATEASPSPRGGYSAADSRTTQAQRGAGKDSR